MKTELAILTLSAGLVSACTADLKVTKDSTAATGMRVDGSMKTTPARPQLDAGESLQSVITGNVWVRVRGLGEGVPTVLIPGAPGTGSFALKGFEAIAEDRDMLRYDLLGTGKSDPLPDSAAVSPRRAADDLESLRRVMKIERWSLVGHSYGASVAIAYAKARPSDVLGVVLINPIFTSSSEGTPSITLTSADSAAYATDLDSLRSMPGAQIDASMRRTLGDSTQGGMSLAAAAAVLRAGRVPTLIIAGERDSAGTNTARQLAKAVPGAKVTIIPDAGAFAVIEARDATRDAVKSFLNAIEPKRTDRLPVKAGPRLRRN